MQDSNNINELAREAYGWFETARRPDSDTLFIRLKDDRPEWLQELVREAHGDFLPDGWRYAAICAALGAIMDNPDTDLDDYAAEWANSYVDAYTSDRLVWLGSNLQRAGYVDDAVAEFGDTPGGIIDQIGLGQYQEASEVFALVLQGLRARLEDAAAMLEP